MASVAVDDLLTELRVACRGAPTLLLRRALLNAARRFCSVSGWWAVRVPLTTTAKKQIYAMALPADTEAVGVRAVSLKEISGRLVPLTEGFSGAWDPNELPAQPDRYQWLPPAGIALSKTPDNAYDAVAYVALQPTKGAESIDAGLAHKWDQALTWGALAWLQTIPGQPFTDKQMAEIYRQRFSIECSSAQINADRGFNAFAALTDVNGDQSGAIRTGQTTL